MPDRPHCIEETQWGPSPCSLKLAVKSISLKADWYAGWTSVLFQQSDLRSLPMVGSVLMADAHFP